MKLCYMRLACVGLFWFCNLGWRNFRFKVFCDRFAAGADIGVGPQEGKYRPTGVTWLWCQALGQHANLAWACLLIT